VVARHAGLLSVVLREPSTFRPTIGSDGRAMYELRVPIAFDRLLVSVVPGLEAGLARVGLASPTGNALMYGDDSTRVELVGRVA
jgi:hypothetical protein